MKRIDFILWTIGASIFLVVHSLSTYADSLNVGRRTWHTDFQKAKQESRRLDLPLLIHFYADWCGPCKKMDREVLSSAELKRDMGRRLIAVKINSDEHRELVDRYDIRALPSDVFIDPHGRIIARAKGYQEPQNYLARVSSVENKFELAKKTYLARNGDSTRPRPNEKPNSNRMRPALGFEDWQDESSASHELTAVEVGLNGFCPISLWNQRQWRRGRQQFAGRYQGVVYFMASATDLNQFERAPERYVPRYLGCDPVMLSQTGRAIRGSTLYGAYFDGALYLFISADNRSQFQQQPEQFTRGKQAFRVDEIERSPSRLSRSVDYEHDG